MMNTMKALKLMATGHAVVNGKTCLLDRTYALIEMAESNGTGKRWYWLPRTDRHFADYREAVRYISAL